MKIKSRLFNYLPSIYQKQTEEEGDPLRAILTISEYLFSGIEETIDNVDNYFDPFLTTTVKDKAEKDFLTWIASWVSLGLDEGWSEQKKRYLIKNAVTLYRYRGTLTGLKYIIEQFFDINVEIMEWEWPHGMEIGRRSSIGIDACLMERLERKQCFKLIWKPSYPDVVKPEFIKKIRTVIDLEKPAHTKCYFHVETTEETKREAITKIQPMVIGVNSTISLCYISQEE